MGSVVLVVLGPVMLGFILPKYNRERTKNIFSVDSTKNRLGPSTHRSFDKQLITRKQKTRSQGLLSTSERSHDKWREAEGQRRPIRPLTTQIGLSPLKSSSYH